MSASRRAGMTSAPSPSTSAGTVVRSESSMSVASSSTRPSLARSRTPPSTWTVPRVEVARETSARRLERSSRDRVTRTPAPTAVSVSIISLLNLSS